MFIVRGFRDFGDYRKLASNLNESRKALKEQNLNPAEQKTDALSSSIPKVKPQDAVKSNIKAVKTFYEQHKMIKFFTSTVFGKYSALNKAIEAKDQFYLMKTGQATVSQKAIYEEAKGEFLEHFTSKEKEIAGNILESALAKRDSIDLNSFKKKIAQLKTIDVLYLPEIPGEQKITRAEPFFDALLDPQQDPLQYLKKVDEGFSSIDKREITPPPKK